MDLQSTHQRTITSQENIKLNLFTQGKQKQKIASWRGFQIENIIDKLKENMHRSSCKFVSLDPTRLNNVYKLKASLIRCLEQKSHRITQGKHHRRHSKHQEKLINDLKENIGKLRENPGFFSGKIFQCQKQICYMHCKDNCNTKNLFIQ